MKIFKHGMTALLISLPFLCASTEPAFAGVSVNLGFHSGGYWHHGWHDGHAGWWWVRGASWRAYPRPYPVYVPQTVVVQQPLPPPVTVVQAAPPAPPATLYYCKSTGTYYPDTMTCPGGWTPVTAGAPPTQ